MWTITLRQPGPMSANTSPFHRSRPPSQQVRPTSPTRSRGLLPRWACAVLAACLALAVFAVGPHAPKADTSSITGDKDLAQQVIGLLPDDYQARGIHVSVITAEGAVDFQTPRGKIPAEVGRRAKLAGKPVIALAGSIGHDYEAVHAAGIDAVMGIIPVPMDLPEAVSRAKELVTDAAERALRLILLGAAIAA